MKFLRYNRNGGTTEHQTVPAYNERRKRTGKTAKDKGKGKKT